MSVELCLRLLCVIERHGSKMTHSGFLGISCCNSAKVLDIIIELLLCIWPQNIINVIKYFPSTVTGCCVASS